MKIHYTVADPSKNITLLVTSPTDRALRPQLGARLIPLVKDARQAAFLDRTDTGMRLETAGGELDACAIMAAAALTAQRAGATLGDVMTLPMEVPGLPEPVVCDVTAVHGVDLVTVTMPLPTRIETADLPVPGGSARYPVVSFPGVSHVIVPAGTVDRAAAREILAHWVSVLNVPAAGMLLWNEGTRALEPLVCRRAFGAAEWLPASADAAAAVAAWMTEKRRSALSLSVKMPGGTVAAVTRWEDRLLSLSVSGTVRLRRDDAVDLVF